MLLKDAATIISCLNATCRIQISYPINESQEMLQHLKKKKKKKSLMLSKKKRIFMLILLEKFDENTNSSVENIPKGIHQHWPKKDKLTNNQR